MIKKDIFAAALAASLVAGLSAPVDAHARHVRYDYRNDQPRQVCHGNGTTGLIVGGVAGGLAGNAIAGQGHRTVGTLLGAAGGGLLGRTIDRHHTKRC